MPLLHAGEWSAPADFTPSHDLAADLRLILRDALQLGDEAMRFNEDTPLLGELPQLDSMGVLAVLTALEQRLGVAVHDDDIDASLFASFGSLLAFVRQRRS